MRAFQRLFGGPNVEKLKAKRDISGLRQAFADNHNSLNVRLDCYSALKEISEVDISELATQELVNLLAIEIKRLYSRTDQVLEEVDWSWRDGGTYEYREVPDPDIEGIRNLVSRIPETLREQVRLKSGDAKELF